LKKSQISKEYLWLLGKGSRGNHVAIAGDSAGGGLAIATSISLRDAGEPVWFLRFPL
jgi:acetyl esterase/lipase